ncbi:uncharacterized protein LY89DRAFT_744093, partial [Mollisia scopiformis]
DNSNSNSGFPTKYQLGQIASDDELTSDGKDEEEDAKSDSTEESENDKETHLEENGRGKDAVKDAKVARTNRKKVSNGKAIKEANTEPKEMESPQVAHKGAWKLNAKERNKPDPEELDGYLVQMLMAGRNATKLAATLAHDIRNLMAACRQKNTTLINSLLVEFENKDYHVELLKYNFYFYALDHTYGLVGEGVDSIMKVVRPKDTGTPVGGAYGT